MRIKIANKAKIDVKRNFEVTYGEAIDISSKINDYLSKKSQKQQSSAAEVYAVNLIGQIFEYIFTNYVKKENPDIFLKTINYTNKKLGITKTEQVLNSFRQSFSSKGDIMEELLVLRLINENPACSPYSIIFDESDLIKNTVYLSMLENSFSFLKTIKEPGDKGLNLIDFLLAPSKLHPDSLMEQLKYISRNWKSLVGDQFQTLLRGIDFLKEENKPHFPQGPGPTQVYTYDYEDGSPEGFSVDSNWMPNVVMIAKSTLVWLDQLSKQYNTSITKLDQIPDTELEIMASRGFSALWLIGLWERSSASRQIKRTCGNPEAESSAYSLKRYEIAEELGGWESLNNLKSRCAQKGIRLASDMVPNHTGIDSDWINEHPDWFIQLPSVPYPNYSFNGQNLSPMQKVGIYLEDHYYNQTDAAVTFKRVDFNNGEERFIYHGNDGTSMPWNDTAQLNYLNPETREAVIQTILHVARNFPVIRFDAAMTLAKKHIQRLWFPEPGAGGDIPTRSEHGLSKHDFNKAIPIEFWREVVDRIKEEAPDTLLLAEAFWMMEGYFVKNLGMHRVYNSAFMNMLKMEENQKYKETIKNTLLHDPEILKRFVNFMNNPDEDTAAEQFGMGDKYFGICTMLSTMPGLPMYGHGQIEGFKEKYGMEYRKAYHDETPDIEFIERHNREIFPILKKRNLFSESENFNLFDMYNQNRTINDNVFAWSNSTGKEYAIVFYNNAFSSATGWIKTAVKRHNHHDTNIGDALNLEHDSNHFCIFKEQRSDLWFIRSSRHILENGIFLHLNGYECQVFWNFREVHDTNGDWKRLEKELNGKGSLNLKRELRKLKLHNAGKKLISIYKSSNTDQLKDFVQKKNDSSEKFRIKLREQYEEFLEELESASFADNQSINEMKLLFNQILNSIANLKTLKHEEEKETFLWVNYIFRGIGMMPELWTLLLSWILSYPLSILTNDDDPLINIQLKELLEDLNIQTGIEKSLLQSNIEEASINEIFKLSLIIASHKEYKIEELDKKSRNSLVLEKYLDAPLIADYIGRNYHQNIEWFKREHYQLLVWWLFTMNTLKIFIKGSNYKSIDSYFSTIQQWLIGEENSECQINLLLESVRIL
jgi:glycosidase